MLSFPCLVVVFSGYTACLYTSWYAIRTNGQPFLRNQKAGSEKGLPFVLEVEDSQPTPELEGDIADLTKQKRRFSPFFNDLRTVNTGYLDENKYKALVDMLTSPVQRWYDTPSLPMEIIITDIDFTHTKMGNQRVNVNLTFCPASRKHQVFDRYSFGGGIFDYTFDRTFE